MVTNKYLQLSGPETQIFNYILFLIRQYSFFFFFFLNQVCKIGSVWSHQIKNGCRTTTTSHTRENPYCITNFLLTRPWWSLDVGFVLCWAQRHNKQMVKLFHSGRTDAVTACPCIWSLVLPRPLFLLVNVGPFFVAWPLQIICPSLAFAGVYPSGMGGHTGPERQTIICSRTDRQLRFLS